jgi:hypothetical protein
MVSDAYETLPDRPPLRASYAVRLRTMIHRVLALKRQIRQLADHCDRLSDIAAEAERPDRYRDLLHLQERIDGLRACASKVATVLDRLDERPA